MDEEIEKLLAILNSQTIRILPCFTDQAWDITDINFRIGLAEGPQISFRRETSESCCLSIRDEKGETYMHPVVIGSDEFIKCRNVAEAIFKLNSDAGYRNMVNDKIEVLLGNLVSLVQPIIARLPPKKN